MIDTFGLKMEPEALKLERRRRLAKLLPQVREMPGAAKLYERIKAVGAPHALVSSATAPHIDTVLGFLGTRHRYHALVSADTLGHQRLKPDPYPYQYTAELFNADPMRCVTFEDTPHGAESAWQAGWIVVAKPNRFVSAKAFRYCAHIILSSHQDLGDFEFAAIEPYLGL